MMKLRPRIWVVVIMTLTISILFVYLAHGQGGRETDPHPGILPYAPSRIEWLALKLQSYYGDTTFETQKFKIVYCATGTDTITILVQYLPGVHREAMSKRVEGAREVVAIEARNHRWDWVQVKEQYKKYD